MVLRKEGPHVSHQQLRLFQCGKVSCTPSHGGSCQCLVMAHFHAVPGHRRGLAAGMCDSHKWHAKTVCQTSKGTLLSMTKAGPHRQQT